MQVEVGSILEGKISGITNFGAFVLLDNGTTGLVHISEVAQSYVEDINAHLKMNETVKVKVLSIDEKGKVSLSIKKALAPESKPVKKPSASQPSFSRKPPAPLTFEDKMKLFMQSSDEKMQDLRRSMDSKRGGGGYKRSF